MRHLNKLSRRGVNMSVIKKILKNIFGILEKWPVLSLILVLLCFIFLFFLGKKRETKIVEEIVPNQVKEISIYDFKQSLITTQALVEKTGYLKIVAQTSGIVNKIYVKEGAILKKNQKILYLSTNYQGSNINVLQKQKSFTNYQFDKDNLEDNKKIINLQKKLIEEKRANYEEIKKIKTNSLNDTNSLLDFNVDLLHKLDDELNKLKENNAGNTNDSIISQLESQKSQLWSGVNQLRSAKYTLDYEVQNDTPVDQLSNLEKELTLNQLALQEKALDLKLKISQIDLRISQVAESLTLPVTPLAGRVEKVFVKIGQAVNAGQVLAIISAVDNETSLVVYLPAHIAKKININYNGILEINQKEIAILPVFQSSDVVNNDLFAFYYQIPPFYQDQFSYNQVVNLRLPLISASSEAVLVPLDSVYQTQGENFVYLVASSEGQLRAKTVVVQMGQVLGNLVEITNGLNKQSQLILNRNVINNDLVEIQKN